MRVRCGPALTRIAFHFADLYHRGRTAVRLDAPKPVCILRSNLASKEDIKDSSDEHKSFLAVSCRSRGCANYQVCVFRAGKMRRSNNKPFSAKAVRVLADFHHRPLPNLRQNNAQCQRSHFETQRQLFGFLVAGASHIAHAGNG